MVTVTMKEQLLVDHVSNLITNAINWTLLGFVARFIQFYSDANVSFSSLLNFLKGFPSKYRVFFG